MIRRSECACDNWRDVVKELWQRSQSMITGIKIDADTVRPDGQGIADITSDLNDAIDAKLGEYATQDDISEAVEGIMDTLDEYPTKNDISDVLTDTSLSTDASTVYVTHERYSDPSDRDALPVASTVQAGVINAADYRAFVKMGQDIQDLQGAQIVYQVNLPSATPTQAEITTAFTTTHPDVTIIAGLKIADFTYNLSYQWTGSAWQNIPVSGYIPIATTTDIGGVKGSTTDGEIAVNLDGSMSLNGYDDMVSDISNLESTKADIADLAAVALSGSYNDLSYKPTIPAAQVNADWNANSGVAQILNKPTIPAAQVNADWNASSGVAEILNKPNLAAVATSGSYDDLNDKPTEHVFANTALLYQALIDNPNAAVLMQYDSYTRVRLSSFHVPSVTTTHNTFLTGIFSTTNSFSSGNLLGSVYLCMLAVPDTTTSNTTVKVYYQLMNGSSASIKNIDVTLITLIY